MSTLAASYPQAKPSGISITPLLSVLLFVALFTGFQGGRYYAGNIAQELGILASGLLFVIGAFTSLFHLPRREWNRWVLSSLLLMGGIIVLWGSVFALQFGGNPLHNIMASREFFFILLAPGVFLCGCCGLSRQSIERVVWAVLVASMLNYLFNYWRLDLREAFFSGDHRISSLVTYDEWRGFRLKPPLFTVMLAMLGGFVLLFGKSRATVKVFTLLVIALACYIWSIVMFRSTLATMLLAIVMYPFFLSRPNRMAVLMVALPLCAIASPVIIEKAYQYFSGAVGGGVRLESYQMALMGIAQRPILGAGEDSAFGVTYAMLYSPKFFPSDLGLVGITFKYGVVGLILYLTVHFGVLAKLCRSHWVYVKATGKTNPIVWGMLIFFTAQTFNLVLNPGLAYAQGITMASLAVALCGLVGKFESCLK